MAGANFPNALSEDRNLFLIFQQEEQRRGPLLSLLPTINVQITVTSEVRDTRDTRISTDIRS